MSKRGNFEGGQNQLGWQRKRRVPNFNENRVAKVGFGYSIHTINRMIETKLCLGSKKGGKGAPFM